MSFVCTKCGNREKFVVCEYTVKYEWENVIIHREIACVVCYICKAGTYENAIRKE